MQATGFVDERAVRSKRGKTRRQAVDDLRKVWEVSKEFGQRTGTNGNIKEVKMIAGDEKQEKMEREFPARGSLMHQSLLCWWEAR